MDIYIHRSGVAVDIETRRKKQQALLLKLVERKVRSRAKQLYQTRGEVDGHALQDWVQAESEVVGNSVLAPLYRRRRSASQDAEQVEANAEAQDFSAQNSSASEKSA
jgi:hypothetical protein